jgi:aminoglycoside phosphotransferase (APT) family kinase protein
LEAYKPRPSDIFGSALLRAKMESPAPVVEPDIVPELLQGVRDAIGISDVNFADGPAALSGGYDTRVFLVRLQNAPSQFSGELVLRLFHGSIDAARAVREATVQNTLARLGYPAPRVLARSAASSRLTFNLMERAPGTMAVEGFGKASGQGVEFRPGLLLIRLVRLYFELPRILADAQTRLHALDPAPFVAALQEQDPAARLPTIAARLSVIETSIRHSNSTWLEPARNWLARGLRPSAPVICHGDFHPFNVLVSDGTITGVIDWSGVTLAERAFDVGITRLAIAGIPLHVRKHMRKIVNGILYVFARRCCNEYRRRHPLDSSAIDYAQVFRCVERLAHFSDRESRPGFSGATWPEGPWDSAAGTARLVSCVRKLSGVNLTAPSRA